MKPEDQAWQRLVAAARSAKDDRDTAAPYGFATRVAAMAMAAERRPLKSLFDRVSWRALGVAGLLAIVSLAVNYSFLSRPADDDVLSDDGTVAALFGVSS